MSLVSGTIFHLNVRRQERHTFYYSRPEVHRLLLLRHPAGLLWPWSHKGERQSSNSDCNFSNVDYFHNWSFVSVQEDEKMICPKICVSFLKVFLFPVFQTTYCLTELAASLRNQVRERLGKDLGTDCKISVSDLETRWCSYFFFFFFLLLIYLFIYLKIIVNINANHTWAK